MVLNMLFFIEFIKIKTKLPICTILLYLCTKMQTIRFSTNRFEFISILILKTKKKMIM